MRRRLLSILLLITVTIFFVTGCSSKSKSETSAGDASASKESSAAGEEAVDTGASTETTLTMKSDAAAPEEAPMKSSETSDSLDMVEPMEPAHNQQNTAGLLTAGEWNDHNHWTFFTNLIANQQLMIPSFGMNPTNRIMVTVLNQEGSPVENARVNLLDSAQEVIWEATSDNNGIAYVFFHVWNNNQIPSSLSISKNGSFTSADLVFTTVNSEQNSNNQTKTQSYQDATVTINDDPSTRSLDLMFVFDTTGSMSDELSYLQTEFEDIAKKVSDQNTRYSVNFYRDEGDEYVIRSNEFASDIEVVLTQLKQEAADGGGDYPEAVDQALNDAIYDHAWNLESVKLLFLILDAPPHSQDAQVNDSLRKSVAEAAKQGIRIIPVASSGVDKDTETFLRTIAILTGGTYTFLTDHSGIGNSHLEPTIGDYEVENLNDCIVRIIKTYYQ